MLRHALVASVAFTALAGSARPANACVGACVASAISEPKSVPSNVSGLPVSGKAEDFTLVDAKGDPVDFAVVQDPNLGAVLEPKSALAPGDYGILWSAGCSRTAKTHHFTVTEAAPEPKSTGTVTVKSTSRILATYPVADYKRGCSDEVDVAVVDLDMAPSPELAPYGEVITWRTTVDGKPWYSRSPVSYADATYQPSANMISHTRVFAYCAESGGASAPTAWLSPGLSEGVHEVQIQAVVPGLPDVAPATIQVELSCAKAGPAPVSTRPKLEGEAPTASSSEPESADSSGCSSTGQRGSTLPAWLLALAVGLVAKRKCRPSSASS